MKKLLSLFAFLALFALAFLLAPCSLRADTNPNDASSLNAKIDALQNKVNDLTEKNKKLQEEIDALRQENQKQRRELAKLPKNAAPYETTTVHSDERITVKSPSSASSQNITYNSQQTINSNQTEGKDYWLNTNTKKRHNSNCLHYKNCKGRPCTKSEGVACKKCGG